MVLFAWNNSGSIIESLTEFYYNILIGFSKFARYIVQIIISFKELTVNIQMSSEHQVQGEDMQIDTKEVKRGLSRGEIDIVFSTISSAYSFMCVEADYYFPKKQYVTLAWLAEVFNGDRAVSIKISKA